MGEPEADLPDYNSEETLEVLENEELDGVPSDGFYPDQEYREDSEDSEEDSKTPEEREVYMKQSRSQQRNRRKRRSKKIKRDQANVPVHERLDANHPNMRRLRRGNGAPRDPQTPTTDLQSDEEQHEAQDTKVPKTKARNQRK